jgi:hypothetical protein
MDATELAMLLDGIDVRYVRRANVPIDNNGIAHRNACRSP